MSSQQRYPVPRSAAPASELEATTGRPWLRPADVRTRHQGAGPVCGPAPWCCGLDYRVGMCCAVVKTSWSLATAAFAAEAVQTAGALPSVAVPGQTNSSGLRVSIQNG